MASILTTARADGLPSKIACLVHIEFKFVLNCPAFDIRHASRKLIRKFAQLGWSTGSMQFRIICVKVVWSVVWTDDWGLGLGIQGEQHRAAQNWALWYTVQKRVWLWQLSIESNWLGTVRKIWQTSTKLFLKHQMYTTLFWVKLYDLWYRMSSSSTMVW